MIKLKWLFFILQGIGMMAYSIENGVYVAALTPLHSDLRCNDEALTEHCLQLMDRGCKGVVLFGTTGEGASFSVEEKKQTLRQVISRGLDPEKIIVGNGSSCLQDTVDIALAALKYNCLACLIDNPLHLKKEKICLASDNFTSVVLALKLACRRCESVICTDIAYFNYQECGAVESIVGYKLLSVPHQEGKITPVSTNKNYRL